MSIDFFTEEFWRDQFPRTGTVRKHLSQGIDPSYSWSMKMLKHWSPGHEFPFRIAETTVISQTTPEKETTRERTHHFLYARRNGDLFIADAFSGFLDPSYMNGFFDYLENAPDRNTHSLKEFYTVTLHNLLSEDGSR